MTDKHRYVARSSKIAARLVGDEMMIMTGGDSTLFTLNPTATALWQAADGVTPLDDIVEQHICARFNVEPADALRDAEEVLLELAGHGIVLLSDAPMGVGEVPRPESARSHNVGRD